MFGLSVRWSLTDAPDGTLERLHAYVEEVSLPRFAGLDGLRYKTWRARDGEWFEGTYVFVSEEARAEYKIALDKAEAGAPMRRVIQLKLDALGGSSS